MKRNFFLIHFFLFVSLVPLHASDSLYFPYKLSLKTDIPVASTATLSIILAYVFEKNQVLPDSADILTLKSSEVNALDRTAVDNYSETADLWSYITLRTTRYSPFLFFIPLTVKKQWYPIVTFSVMYYEALMINRNVTSITKSLTNRARPYLYGSDLTLEEKNKKGKSGFRAFYSGHASSSFCSAVFLSKVFSDMYPSSKLKGFVWAVSMTVATTTGILRYTAGKHFPTDVITGACMGGLVGYLIPVLHKKKMASVVSVYPIVGENCGVKVVFSL